VPRVLKCLSSKIGVLLTLLLVGLLPIEAHAQIKASITTVPASPAHRQTRLTAASCPNQGGILNSISVPVGMPLTLQVLISTAQATDTTYQLSSEDASIVAAGDPRQSFLPMVTIPAGQTMSNPFQVFGIMVGATTLDATSLSACCPSFSDPIGAWDISPGSDPSMKFLDANPPSNTCRVSGSASLSGDPTLLSTCGQPVKGAVTDGVTQVLMRMVSGLGGTACYEITSTGPPDQGTIPPAMSVIPTQTVGSLNYGFAFYQTPTSYGDTSSERQVQIQFTFTPNIGNSNTTMFTLPLTLVRPPLMLIHGLWSDRKAWPSFWTRSPDNDYVVYKADYAATHDASFTTNAPMVQGFVANTVNMARSENYAATQADVIAHSMGGILTRYYAASSQYMRVDNYNMGDIHRFITLDTPHGGSSFANLLVTLHGEDPVDLENTVTGLTHGSVVNGAVCDLSEDSPALVPLASATNIKSQVVTATGGPTSSFWNGVGPFHLGSFQSALTATKCVKRVAFVCTQTAPIFDQKTVTAFTFSRPNDAIIAICAQQGGVGGTTCPDSAAGAYNFSNLIHFGADVFFFTAVAGVTNTQAVATTVFPLLDGPDSALSDTIPGGLASTGTGKPVTVAGLPGVDEVYYGGQCTGTAPPMKRDVVFTGQEWQNVRPAANTATPNTADSRVQITTPTNGQVFAPGDTVSVTVSIAAGLSANDVALLVPLLGRLPGTSYNGSTYQVSFTIPDTVAGPFALTPLITDTGNNPINGVTTTIAVRPTTPPTSLTLSQSNYILTTVSATERVDVIGNYAGGIQRDLTSSASGTTYTSSNTAVITVDSEGNVTATGLGTASVTVTNSGVKAFATFTVEDPAHPLAAQDVTTQVTVVRAGFRVDRNTGFFDQSVQWNNTGSVPVIGPLYFVATGLPTGVTLISAGSTKSVAPTGSPYLALPLPDGVTLQPGQSLTGVLRFLDPGRTQIAYTPKVFRTLTTP
jgi:pimeloyl-ACP methyl ester carboxylesterase